MAVRVHELAADLEIDANDLISNLERLDISVRNHMSRIKDKDTEKVYNHYRKLNNQRAIDWAKTKATEKPAKEAKPEAVADDQHLRIEEALARARAARAQADAQRKSAAATMERQKLADLRTKQAVDAAAAAAGQAAQAPAAAQAPSSEQPSASTEAPAPAPRSERPTPSRPPVDRDGRPPRREHAAPRPPRESGRPQSPRPGAQQRPPYPGRSDQRPDSSGRGPQRPDSSARGPRAPYPGRSEQRPDAAGRGGARAPYPGRNDQNQDRPSPTSRGPVRGKPGKSKSDPVDDMDLNNLTIEVMKLDGDGKRTRRRDKKKHVHTPIGVEDVEDDSANANANASRRPVKGKPTKATKSTKPTRVVGPTTRKPGVRPRTLMSKRPAPPKRQIPVVQKPKKIKVHGEITTSQLAEKMRIDGADIIKKTLEIGQPVTLNDIIERDLLELLAMELGYELEIIPDTDESDVEPYEAGRRDESRYAPRPPVVTIMGHVDHGKTSLLEQIAKLEVLRTEHGGITQHIAAYHVQTSGGEVVFLDTPGHAAFTAMRMRGAQATDIVALVVAANDGVMPQTVEAINHAKAAGVPIVVVINKMDLPEANPSKVKQQLMAYDLLPEEFGGQTLFCEISAKKGIGIDQLLETLLLQSEILELRADPKGPANGIVIEALLNQQRGIEATVLVQQGSLKVGDVILSGQTFGRIRSMLDHLGRPVVEAKPSFPARIYGLTGDAPEAGEPFLVMPDEREARFVAEKRAHRRRTAGLNKRPHISLEGLKDYLDGEEVKELHLIIKGDVQGSIEAIEQSLNKIPHTKVRIHILHSAVGGVNETDVRLAGASDAIILGFNVRPDNQAEFQAQQEGIEIKCYNIIYDLLSDIEAAMVGMLDAKFKEVPQGKADVLETFKVSKVGTIAGCIVTDGDVRRDSHIRLVRDGKIIFTGKVVSLKRHKDDANRVQSGLECGIGIENFNDIKKGDVIESFSLQELEKTLI